MLSDDAVENSAKDREDESYLEQQSCTKVEIFQSKHSATKNTEFGREKSQTLHSSKQVGIAAL